MHSITDNRKQRKEQMHEREALREENRSLRSSFQEVLEVWNSVNPALRLHMLLYWKSNKRFTHPSRSSDFDYV